ncbi:HMG box-containing protein 4-like [Varroa jacobsoni]|uniref:HMG box-containing protein 4-like n=1 Tax=Varroa jacobsoni TaxID=62625 RepID=UPI000BFA3E2F|nr:HMG box-containing protein 4-like [Varroa jacobsoni]
MSTLGVSRSGRIRKKSAKVVEMENFDGEEGEDSNRPAFTATTTIGSGMAISGGSNHPQQHHHLTQPQSTIRHQTGYTDSKGNESGSRNPSSGLSSAVVVRKGVTAISVGAAAARRPANQNHNSSSQHQQLRQNRHNMNVNNSHNYNSGGAHVTFGSNSNTPSNNNNQHNSQFSVDNSSSTSSESESDDSSDNDSDSDELPYPLQKVTAQQMVQLQALQKGRRPKQAAPQRSRQYSSSSTHEYDPPYNPKTGTSKISGSTTSLHKNPTRKLSPNQPQRAILLDGQHHPLHQQHPQHKMHQQRHAQQPMRIPAADSEMSSSNEEDSDEESDSGDSLIIDSGDGFAKKAPIRKLKLSLATATALATAQRQKMRQRQEEVEDEPSEDNDDDDDDFVPSSAKRRKPSGQSSHPPAIAKKTAAPPPEKKSEPSEKVEPKKPKAPSAYVMYCSDIRKKLLAENPSLTFAELSKRMGQMWNHLPEKDKQLWKRKAKSLQAKNASGLITTGKQPMQSTPTQVKIKAAEKKAPAKAQPAHPPVQKIPLSTKAKTTIPTAPKPVAGKTTLKSTTSALKTTSAKALPKSAAKGKLSVAPSASTTSTIASAASSSSYSSSNLQALISNYQELLDKPVEAPPRPFGHSPLDAAAHLKLLGESLTTIGTNLMEHQGPIAVSGSLSVLLDSTLCALGPLVCLTAQLDELDGSRPETLRNILNNIAYIMPGL